MRSRAGSVFCRAVALLFAALPAVADAQDRDGPAPPAAPLDMTDDLTCLALAMYWEAKGEGD